jgi:hypothetical protein
VSESDTWLSPASKGTGNTLQSERSANVKQANHQANDYKADIKQAKLANQKHRISSQKSQAANIISSSDSKQTRNKPKTKL